MRNNTQNNREAQNTQNKKTYKTRLLKNISRVLRK